MKLTEPIYVFRMSPRIMRRQMKCCTQNNGDQTNTIQKPNEPPPEFRRVMTEMYVRNIMQGSAFVTETDMSASTQPALPVLPEFFEEVEDTHIQTSEEQKAMTCAQLPCQAEDQDSLVCACNFKSGRVVSFKNECDLRRHNCRFNTDFRVILNDVCPWQYDSRRDSTSFDYSNPSYYN